MAGSNGIPNVVFLDRETLPASVRLSELGFAHRLTVHDRTAAHEVASRIADADIVITNKVPLRADALATAHELKLVAVAATGTDVVDLDICASRGITVSNIRNYAIHTVPEHTFALIFALRRSIVAYHGAVANGRWQEAGQFCFFDYPIKDLAGSTIGIIGDGALGQSVAAIAKALGMRPLFSAYKGEPGMGPLYTPFEDILKRSDIITIHAPLMPSTRNMIGRSEFGRMERKPLIINTARGGIVDEEALSDALLGNQIAGAGFDVVTIEPPPADHPFMRLLDRPNFILTPHVAWASQEAVQSLADQLIGNVEAYWTGRPRNVVAHPVVGMA